MPILIDFFNIFIVGIAENIIELYFFAKLNGKKAKLSHYILLSAINNSFINLVPAALPAKLLINAVLLVLFGVFIYKAGIKTAVLYTIIIVEVMELCFGIFNSLAGILSPLLYPVNPKAVGLIFMIINSFCSLLLSCLCYSVIHKYFVYSETEKNRYILMLFMPLLMILMLSEFISNSVYSNTIVLSRRGEMNNTNHLQMLVIQGFGILSLFCIIYVFQKLIHSFRINMQLSMLEQENYHQKQYVSEAKSRYEKTQSFRHDIKNHLSVIHGLLEKGEIKKAEEYLENMEPLMDGFSFPCHTNNPVLDILIGNKLGIAEDKGIAVSCSLKLPYPCTITDIDLCIILSNALDNAIHGCEKITANPDKCIELSGHMQGDFLLLEIKNSYYGKAPLKKGIGLSNIKSIADKYNGAMSINTHKESFCLNVLLIIPQQEENISRQRY